MLLEHRARRKRNPRCMTERRGTSETAVLTADVCIVVSRVAHTLFLLVVLVVVVWVGLMLYSNSYIITHACMLIERTWWW